MNENIHSNTISNINRNSSSSVTNNTPKEFEVIDGNTLMAQEFEPLQFAVEKILPHGLFILAGSGKIGKSWLSLDIAVSVSTGGNMWELNAQHGSVLYLALEDNFRRLKDRLQKIEAQSIDIAKLKLTTAAFGISGGLIQQVNSFLAKNPDTKLIVVDTLERIRDTEMDGNIYSCDYRDMMILREITDAHNLTLLLIHHTRKLSNKDPLNTLSGSMGLVGATDGVFVLEKETRVGNIANRDTEGFCFKLELDPETCKWRFLGNADDVQSQAESESESSEERNELLCLLVDDWLKEKTEWSGTATELCSALNEIDGSLDITPLNVRRKLEASATLLKDEFNIILENDRNSNKRLLLLKRQAEQ